MNEFEETLKRVLKGECHLILKEVKAQKFSGVIYIPKRYIGKKVMVIIKNEE